MISYFAHIFEQREIHLDKDEIPDVPIAWRGLTVTPYKIAAMYEYIGGEWVFDRAVIHGHRRRKDGSPGFEGRWEVYSLDHYHYDAGTKPNLAEVIMANRPQWTPPARV